MYAVIKTGGKQYKVAKDDVVVVEKLAGTPGDAVQFNEVLLVADGDKITPGSPLVEGASVAAEVVEQTRGDKIIVFKKIRRHNYRRKKGHRQDLTVLKVTDILTGGKKSAKAEASAPAAEESAPEEKPAAKKTATKKAATKKPATEKKPAAAKKAATEKKAAAKKVEKDEAPAESKAAEPESKTEE